MITILTNIMRSHMITKQKINIILILTLSLLTGCALSPGMDEPTKSQIKKLEQSFAEVSFQEIDQNLILSQKGESSNYNISKGDTLSIVVFGLNEFFPLTYSGLNNPYTSKLVDEKGFIFFPYAGSIYVEGLTVGEVRDEITKKLAKGFNDPQVDVSIIEFNSKRNVYIIGEVFRPTTIKLGLVSLSLSEALSQAQGLSQTTSKASHVYVLRRNGTSAKIFRADMSNVGTFAIKGQFELSPGDIIFISASDITKWNRFISQLFPFASFLNQIDNLQTD